jgi:hypothetical protein
MQQQACRIALGNRAVVLSRSPTAQDQFRCVLNDNNMPTGSPLPGQTPGMQRHLCRCHRGVVKKPAKLHFPGPVTAKATDTRTGPRHQRRMQPGPPFFQATIAKSPQCDPGHRHLHRVAPDRESRFTVKRN